jgi:hypothetical protein
VACCLLKYISYCHMKCVTLVIINLLKANVIIPYIYCVNCENISIKCVNNMIHVDSCREPHFPGGSINRTVVLNWFEHITSCLDIHYSWVLLWNSKFRNIFQPQSVFIHIYFTEYGTTKWKVSWHFTILGSDPVFRSTHKLYPLTKLFLWRII